MPSAISVSTGVAAQSVFFVVMLSISQKISFGDLIINFVVRTLICIPIIALFSHLLF